MLLAIEREQPALCFFLGDGERDLEPVLQRFPSLVIHAVRGNCDLRSELPKYLCCTVGGLRVFAAHGHQYDVKYDPLLQELCFAAKREGADVLLFGHTHRAHREHSRGMEILNPGPVGSSSRPSYGLLHIDGGRAETEIIYL